MSQLRYTMKRMKRSKLTGYNHISMEMLYKIRKSVEPLLLKLVNNKRLVCGDKTLWLKNKEEKPTPVPQ